MEQPKKGKSKMVSAQVVGTGNLNGDYLELTPEEIKRNKSVKQQSTTDKFKKEAMETQKVSMNDGKAERTDYEKKLDIQKMGSGKKSRLIDGKGNVIQEVDAGSDKEKEMIRVYNRDKKNTEQSRQRAADVINYQTEKELEGNPVYEKKMQEQGKAREQRVASTRVRVGK